MVAKPKKIFKLIVLAGLIFGAVYTSFLLTEFVLANQGSQELIQRFGYLGILIISFVTGLNLFLPIPAATFVPVFEASGISLPVIITLLVIGTMAANLLSYALGRYGGKITHTHYPKIEEKLVGLYTSKKRWLPYFVFAFAAFMPLPDEVYLIPLGILSVKLKQFILPLFLGTICFQTLAALGIANIFAQFLT